MASPNGDGYFFRRSVNFVDTSVKRGDIYYADLSPVVGSEQGGVRPVLIIQNDTGNRYSPTVIAAAITSQTGKARLPDPYRPSGERELRPEPGFHHPAGAGAGRWIKSGCGNGWAMWRNR